MKPYIKLINGKLTICYNQVDETLRGLARIGKKEAKKNGKGVFK